MSGWGWLQWLGLIAGGVLSVAATFAGLAWTLGRIFRPWMRNEVRDGNEALYEAGEGKRLQARGGPDRGRLGGREHAP